MKTVACQTETFRHSHSDMMVLSQHGHVLFYSQSLLALAQGEPPAWAAQCQWGEAREASHPGVVVAS